MTNTKLVTCTVLALSFVAVVFAQEEGQQGPPLGGTPKDFVLPATDVFGLDNGLQATLIPFGNVPKATVSIIIRSGNLNEGDQTWLADLSGDFFLEGSTSRSGEDIARAAAAIGGQINVVINEDQTTISGDVLAEFTPQMVELLAEVVRSPAFGESELERLKRDRLRTLSVAQTQPQQMANAAFRKALYGDHPYGRVLPDEALLAAYSMDDVRNFYDNNFGAQRTQVYVAGVFDAESTRAAIEDSFGTWDEGPGISINIPDPVSGKVVVDVVDRPGASQSNVILGLPTVSPGHDDRIALEISNTLLGGYFSSRITANIREDKGYTYSPRSSLSTRYHDSYWAQTAAISTNDTGAALQEIMYEIDNLQKNPPPVDELDGVKNYAAGIFVLRNSTRNGIINVLNQIDLQELPDTYLTDYVSNVFAISPEQVSEMTSKYLRQEDMTLTVVGDRGLISEQVAPFIEAEAK